MGQEARYLQNAAILDVQKSAAGMVKYLPLAAVVGVLVYIWKRK